MPRSSGDSREASRYGAGMEQRDTRRTALVTGATRGIGRALSEVLLEQGVIVYASGRNAALLSELSEETGALTGAFDLAEADAPARLYADCCEKLGAPPDFVVNNAGFNSRKMAFVNVEPDEFDAQYAVNFRAPALISQLALADMSARAKATGNVGGHLVNVLSTVVHFANETMSVYTAMKHGLHGLTKVLIKEGRTANVKVSAVYPGGTDTDFRESERPDYLRPRSVASAIAQVLLGPEDLVVHELTFRPMVETNFP
jgi:NAD(P)-dependent dehydrogenase (short-subunit alcohol dehydrogenase family)